MHNRDFHLPPATNVLPILLYCIRVAAVPPQCLNVDLIVATHLRTTPLTEFVIVGWRQSAFPPVTTSLYLKSRVVIVWPLLHLGIKVALTQFNSSSVLPYDELIGSREIHQIALRYLIWRSGNVEHDIGVHGNKGPFNVSCY